MTEHLSSAQIENHVRQKLGPKELLSLDNHLAECEKCRQLVESALDNDVVMLYAELAAEATIGAHLTFEQNAAYVDGLLASEERQMVEDHLASCAQCAPLVADLRACRKEIAPELNLEDLPEGAVAPASRQDRIVFKRRIDGQVSAAPPARLRSYDQPGSYAPPRYLTWVAAGALGSFLLVGWIVWRAATRQKPPQIAVTSPTPLPSPSIDVASPTPEIAPALVLLNDGGGRVILNTKGELIGGDQWIPDYQHLVREALTAQRAEKSPQLARLSRQGSSLMGGDDEGRRFGVIEPVGKIVLTDRPTFRWSKLKGAAGYIVEVYDAQFKRAAISPLLTKTNWTTPLARSQTYLWQVKAINNGKAFIAPSPPAPQAKFSILDRATAAEIARAQRNYASSHLLMGLLYARTGLIAEAEKEFTALQLANPDSEVARKLLASVSESRL